MSTPDRMTRYEKPGWINRIIQIPPKVVRIEINGSMISMVFNVPVIMLLKKKITLKMRKINVIEMT